MDPETQWDAELAAFDAGQPPPEAQTEQPEAAAPDAQAVEVSPETPAPEPLAVEGNNSEEPKPSVADLSYVLPDDPRLPPTLRGKTLNDLYEDRAAAWAQAHKAGYDANELKRRLEVTEQTIERVRQAQEVAARPAAPQLSMSDRLRQRGADVETDIITDPSRVFGATVDIAAEESMRRASETFQQYENRIAAMEREVQDTRVRAFAQQAQAAFQVAKPATVPQELWDRAAHPIALSLMSQNRQLDLTNPTVLRETFEQFYGPAATYAAPTAAGVARAAAPPVSGRPSAAPTAPSKKRFGERERGYMREAAKGMGISDADTDMLEDQFLTEWGTR